MRRLGLALVLLLACTTAAHAQRGLSPTEKDQARKAYNATQQMHQAIENLAETIRVASGATARTALKDVWAGLEFHAREIGLGSFWLIGINTAMPTLAEFDAIEALPRATWVSTAWTKHDNSLGSMTITIGQVDTALAVGGQVGAYTTRLTALRANLVAAQGYINGINRALQYGQARNLPFCRDAANAQGSQYDAKRGSCNVFGPHGNWILATQHLQMGWQQLIVSTVPTLRNVYTANGGSEATMPDSTNGSVADMLVDFARLADNLMVVEFNFAAIATTPTQCGFTPLRLVMRTIERILQFGDTTNSTTTPAEGGPIAGNPFFWAMRGNMASTLDGLNSALASRPTTHGQLNAVLSDILLAWRFSEGGFWLAFEMPSDLQNVIIGGTIPGSPAPGTTVFPYYFGVTRSSQLRVYVRNAGSTSNRTPKVEGVDYTVSGVGNPSGGTITFTTPPPTDFHVQIERVGGTRLEELRAQPYPENDPAVGTVGPCS